MNIEANMGTDPVQPESERDFGADLTAEIEEELSGTGLNIPAESPEAESAVESVQMGDDVVLNQEYKKTLTAGGYEELKKKIEEQGVKIEDLDRHCQVVGIEDSGVMAVVAVLGSKAVVRVPVFVLEKFNRDEVQKTMKDEEAARAKVASQYAGNINQADVQARERYRREVAEGKRQPGDMSGLGM